MKQKRVSGIFERKVLNQILNKTQGKQNASSSRGKNTFGQSLVEYLLLFSINVLQNYVMFTLLAYNIFKLYSQYNHFHFKWPN